MQVVGFADLVHGCIRRSLPLLKSKFQGTFSSDSCIQSEQDNQSIFEMESTFSDYDVIEKEDTEKLKDNDEDEDDTDIDDDIDMFDNDDDEMISQLSSSPGFESEISGLMSSFHQNPLGFCIDDISGCCTYSQ
jgi:hypothetical protein